MTSNPTNIVNALCSEGQTATLFQNLGLGLASPIDPSAMSRGLSLPQTPEKQPRPTYLRSHTTPSIYHPAQLARAQLGDTSRAAYLPMDDWLSTSNGRSTTLSLFGRAHDPSLPSTYPPTPVKRKTDYFDLTRNMQSSMIQNSYKHDFRRPEANKDSNCPALATDHSLNIASDVASWGSHSPASLAEPGRTKIEGTAETLDGQTEESVSKHSDHTPEVQIAPKCSDLQHKSHREDSANSSATQSHVHFTLDEPNRFRYSVVADDVHDLQFLDPFDDKLAFIRWTSTGLSDLANYLRPNAFAGHRDTLARLRPSRTFSSADLRVEHDRYHKKHSTGSVTSAVESVSSDRAAARCLELHGSEPTKIPAHIMRHILCYVSYQDYQNMRLTCRRWLEALPRPASPPACD